MYFDWAIYLEIMIGFLLLSNVNSIILFSFGISIDLTIVLSLFFAKVSFI